MAAFVKLDVNMGRLMLERQDESAQKFPSEVAVARQFVADLRQLQGCDVTVYKNKWPEEAPGAAGRSIPSPTNVCIGLSEVNAQGARGSS